MVLGDAYLALHDDLIARRHPAASQQNRPTCIKRPDRTRGGTA